jgi:hypothetical protein
MSLSKKQGPTRARKTILVEFEAELEVDSTRRYGAKPHEGHNKESKEIIDSKENHIANLKKKWPTPKVVVYRHPHHIEKQQSSMWGCEHQHTYELAWRSANTTRQYHNRETITWHHKHDKNQDQGFKEVVGHHVHLPLGWMDSRIWYQLATFLSWSYFMVSSCVSRMKHVKGDEMYYT